MSQKDYIFKENYNEKVLTLTSDYSNSLKEKELKYFKKDLYNILLEINNKKLRTFKSLCKKLDSMLKHSEKLYKELPLSDKIEGIDTLLKSYKELEKFLNTYHKREEISENVIEIRKSAKKKRAKIETEIQAKKTEHAYRNKLIKKDFISSQWSGYKKLLDEDISFLREVKKAIRRHFKINVNSNFEIYEYLIKIIKARKSIIDILRARIGKKKTNLNEKTHKPETLLPEMRHFSFAGFFSYILLNSDLLIESKNKSCIIKLDINKFYKNFFRLFSKSDKNFNIKQKVLKFDKNLFVPTLLGTDKVHSLKYLFDKTEVGILSYKEVQTNNIIDLDLELKHIKKLRSKPDEPKTTLFVKHQSKVLIKLNIKKIILNLFRELYPPDQEVLIDTQLRKIKKTKNSPDQEVSIDTQVRKIKKSKISHRIVKKSHIKVVATVVVIILTGLIIYAFYFSNLPSVVYIQKYDSVKIQYAAWESDERKNYNVLDPLYDDTIWVTMVPITENDTTGLILGLYDNLLGKGISFESGLLWLDKCIDQDRNGIDDLTGAVALSYGNSSDLYFNTSLMIEFKVLGIQKALQSSPNSEILDRVLPIVVGVFVVILIGIVIFESGVLVRNYRRARKIKLRDFPELKYSVRENILKYGLLALIIPSIPIIVLFSVNERVPLSHFDLLIEYYPGTLEIIITLIVVLWIVTIPLFLFFFKMIKRKRDKRE